MLRRSLAILAVTAVVLVFAPPVSAGGGCHWNSTEHTQSASSHTEVAMDIADCRYEPTTLFIRPGTTVTWTNKDYVPHTVTGSFLTLNGDEWLEEGDSASVTFEEEGAFAYYCILHPGMAASVVVGDPRPPAMKSAAFQPPSGDDQSSGDGSSAGSFPMGAGIAGIAVLGVAGAGLVVRRRRRTVPMPTPGVLP